VTSASEPLSFDGAFLRRLERLSIQSRRSLLGQSSGPRRSPRRGSSVEFADFRDYAPGDDLRRVDWKAYGRLDRLFIRLYQAEEISTVTLLLDRSASMGFGSPSKASFAGRLAAVFAYIGLHSYDLVAVGAWGEKLDRFSPPRGGKAAVPAVWGSIASLTGDVAGPTDFQALRTFRHLRRGPGITVIFSDFLTESDWQSGLRALRGAGQEVDVIQILAPEELDPTIRGDWKLQDSETGAEIEITLSPRLLKRYQEELAAHTSAVRDYCRKHGVGFLQIRSDASIEDAVMADLYRARLVA
jgi:uncharacterized protein (DUF58 family)